MWVLRESVACLVYHILIVAGEKDFRLGQNGLQVPDLWIFVTDQYN